MKNTAQHILVHPTTGNTYRFVPQADHVQVWSDDDYCGETCECDSFEGARASYRRLRSLGYEAR